MMKRNQTYIRPSRSARVSRAIAVACALFLLGSVLWYAFPVHGESEIYDAVIRLHVIAASDSERDQADKLAVRDAILVKTSEVTGELGSREEARAVLEGMLPLLEERAEAVLRSRGNESEVRVVLGEETYPTRSYDSFCFPAGEYLSLRVMIGEASGQNFWCVLFPPMCLGAASVPKQQAEDAMIAVGLSPNQYRVITETQTTKYKLRFRILEFFEELW